MMYFSTECADERRFLPHGRVDGHVLKDRIVVCKAYGPFNKELIEVLACIQQQAFAEYKLKWCNWAYILEFYGDCMLTGDAGVFYQGFLRGLKENGLAPNASAFIFDVNAECCLLGKKLYQDIYHYAGLKFADFSKFDLGLAWIKQQLLSHQLNNPQLG